MKLGAVLALLIAGCAASGPAPEQPSRRAYVETAVNRTVQVFADCEDGGGSGSGVVLSTVVSGSYIATANHVVDGKNCLFKVDNQIVEIVAVNEDYDIAILVSPKHYRVEQLKLAEVYIGLPVMAVGYPYQRWDRATGLQVTDGTLSAFVQGRFKFSAPIYFGSSGGAVFDGNGALVGLVTNGDPDADGEYFMTPGSKVFALWLNASL